MRLIPKQTRERILLYAGSGAGKSYAVLTIAQLLQTFSPSSRMHVLDTDCESTARTIDALFPSLTNVDIYDVFTWRELTAALQKITATIKRDDWICCDLICKTWDWCQDQYTRDVYGKNLEDHFLHQRKMIQSAKTKDSNALEGFRDWPTIKAMNAGFLDDLLFKSHCNVICCATPALVDDKKDGQQIIDEYGRIGLRPAGVKKLDHHFHSVAFMSHTRNGYRVQFTKDRGRALMEGDVSNFAMEYLIGVAGWRVE